MKLPRNPGKYNPGIVSLRCPSCRREGAFHGAGSEDLVWTEEGKQYQIGIRVCPVNDCGEPVFILLLNNELFRSYPAETLDFDPRDVPDVIKQCLEEALICHSNGCYRAAAIMLRRTLEELCSDQNAQGNNLKDRIAALSGTLVLPKGLLDAATELRLLGNDAAHIEAQVFSDVGKEEVEAAVDLVKELLKAVYQYKALVDKLQALRKK